MLKSVIAREGLGDQYRWLIGLLTGLAEGFDSPSGHAALAGAADVARRVWADPASRDFLLEMAIAAHTDSVVCDRLAEQIRLVVEARTAEVADAVQVGLVHSMLEPHEVTWFLQTPPIALRMMSAIGIEPTDEEYQSLLRLVAVMLWSGEEP